MAHLNQYLIAGHLCEVTFLDEQSKAGDLLPSCRPFQVNGEEAAQAEPAFHLIIDDSFRFGKKGEEIGQFDCGGNNFGVYREEQGGYQILISNSRQALCCLLHADATFRHCTAALLAKNQADRCFGINNAMMLAYAFSTASKNTLLMHASVVRRGGMGHLFLGKSGTGKSTHTQLWQDHLAGCDLMNDDNPVVRIVDGQCMVYGSPWSGKTPCYKNTQAPVKAFVQLQQCPQNAMRRQTVVEAFASMLPSISTMKWDKRIYAAHMSTISSILNLVPTYHLGCLPNAEAAQLCYDTLYSSEA